MVMDEYTARVLDVVKGKFGLKNRSEALQKMALEIGPQYVDQSANEDALRELDAIYESHKKHSQRRMTAHQLKELLHV